MSSSSESAQHRPVIFRWIGQDGLIESDFICAECTPRSLEGVIFFPCPVIEPETTTPHPTERVDPRMSTNVDTKKMREALAQFSSETVVIQHEELVNLLDRVERGEQLRSDLDAWFAELPQKLAR